MTTRSVAHGSFSIDRTYPAAPHDVFAAWALQAAKDAWFGSGDDFLATTTAYSLDFRVGGQERLEGRMLGGRHFVYEAVYQDIVDDRRIIAAYDVQIDGRRQSVSLMTVTFEEATPGTRLTLTEQGAFLDGLDSNDQRQEGAVDGLNKLGSYLEANAPQPVS